MEINSIERQSINLGKIPFIQFCSLAQMLSLPLTYHKKKTSKGNVLFLWLWVITLHALRFVSILLLLLTQSCLQPNPSWFGYLSFYRKDLVVDVVVAVILVIKDRLRRNMVETFGNIKHPEDNFLNLYLIAKNLWQTKH